ncbi:MAG: hydrolase, CocE/NonD family [Solirubrobacteraceae bacterium]|nr:hydrolase, CocE/NonD family [Solirubrobacteraceae bacterium]
MHVVRRASALALILLGALTGAAHASTALCNVPITMSDGAVMRANIWLPSQSGAKFPTVLTVSGYNKDATNPTGQSCSGSGGLATADTALADKGYAVMLIDDRGTGASQGKWDSWGERTQLDYQDELDWIQKQPWSDGSVATTGGSYMGITSLLVAEADAARVREGKPRAVKAVWADIPMSDAYRDVTFHGGSIDAGFIPLWLGLTTSLSDLPPSTMASDPQGSLSTYADHLRDGYDFAAQKVLDTTLGKDAAYDGPFYRLRSPGDRAGQIRVPVVIQGGWWDIFQRGEPRLYEQLTHSPYKKLIMSPHYHTTSGPAMTDPNLKDEWFDHWLKGSDNGVQDAPAVSLYPMNGTAWQHYTTWPVPGVKYTPFYLDAGKALAASKPAAAAGDTAPLLPASSPCSRMTTQWTAGTAQGPCETDNRTFEATGLTYTTPPLDKDTELTGPVVANVWAEMTSTDATLVGVVSDVDPSGASNQVTAGFLLASQRKVDAKRSTYGPGHVLIRPFHPFTQASQQPVTPNDPALYRIEIYPTSAVFKKGDSIRLTINSADTPATMTPVPDLVNELGGNITVLHGGRYGSDVLLPVSSGG